MLRQFCTSATPLPPLQGESRSPDQASMLRSIESHLRQDLTQRDFGELNSVQMSLACAPIWQTLRLLSLNADIFKTELGEGGEETAVAGSNGSPLNPSTAFLYFTNLMEDEAVQEDLGADWGQLDPEKRLSAFKSMSAQVSKFMGLEGSCI
mmetsp:Transcript_8048/g.13509  ORF Transcript_8048/g.13509 Transcript_8048/m.13509 type:complete len:151 (+) Transcript_8048:835-1287(+)